MDMTTQKITADNGWICIRTRQVVQILWEISLFLQKLFIIQLDVCCYTFVIWSKWIHTSVEVTNDYREAMLGTNLIHDFTALTFSMKLAFIHEKCPFPWNPWFFMNFNTFTFIYEGFRVLSAASVRILLFATICHTSALNSWHVFTVLLTYILPH